MEAYCVKCRAKREIKDPKAITMRNKRPATQGVCPICGTKMFRIGKSEGKAMAMGSGKRVSRLQLGDIPGDKVFWVQDGRMLKNLGELAAALSEMSPETFRHHITGDRNDFSNWVRDVIRDQKLARDLDKSPDQAQAAKKVGERVSFLRSKL